MSVVFCCVLFCFVLFCFVFVKCKSINAYLSFVLFCELIYIGRVSFC